LCLRSLFVFAGEDTLDMFQQVFDALGLGITAAWLVYPLFGLRSRMAAFLAVLVAAGAAALLAFVVRADWSELVPENVVCLILLGLSVLGSALAISLAGRFCRRTFRAVPFLLWVLGAVVAGWCAAATPLLLVRVISPNGPSLSGVALGVLTVALVHFLILSPFLLLSIYHPFHRERLAPICGNSGS
jgi:hypothetical protein